MDRKHNEICVTIHVSVGGVSGRSNHSWLVGRGPTLDGYMSVASWAWPHPGRLHERPGWGHAQLIAG